jgi:hypothetical protein
MRVITSAADRLLGMVVPKTTAGACHCAYTLLKCACRNHVQYYLRAGHCVGCSPSCGCIPPVCNVPSGRC